MKAKRAKVEQAVETDTTKIEGEQAEGREMAAETEDGGYATIEDIRKGLFGFMPAIMRHMHFPGNETGDGELQSKDGLER